MIMLKLNLVFFQLNENIIQDIKGSVKDILKAQEEEKTRKKDNRSPFFFKFLNPKPEESEEGMSDNKNI